LIISLGIFYIILSIILLLLPIVFIELGRSKDLIKGGLTLFLGIYIIIQRNFFSYSDEFFLVAITVLSSFFVFEISLFRWNQLDNNEKNKFKTPSKYSKIAAVLKESINFGFKKLIYRRIEDKDFNKKSSKKKWVRLEDNNKISKDATENTITSKVISKQENQSEEDIIESEEKLV